MSVGRPERKAFFADFLQDAVVADALGRSTRRLGDVGRLQILGRGGTIRARDLIRAGVPQTVAQKMTGHKTTAIFSRYNITNDDDKREAVRQVAAYRARMSTSINIANFSDGGSR